jgi:hypothetical protein
LLFGIIYYGNSRIEIRFLYFARFQQITFVDTTLLGSVGVYRAAIAELLTGLQKKTDLIGRLKFHKF